MSFKEQWSVADFAIAMEQSAKSQANQKYLRTSNDKLLFNGFWRNGDKPNVCIWLKKATWADAKTGEGGGCREFAKVAFNLSLPEFMARFGRTSFVPPSIKDYSLKPIRQKTSINDIWSKLVGCNSDYASRWLKEERGFDAPKTAIGSGFASLEKKHVDLFNKEHRGFIAQRLSLGQQIVVPIRSILSSRIENLFFRSLAYVDVNDKSRLLPDCGGWTEKDGSPRAFGFPHLIHDFSRLVLCEGMADYFATECLLAGDSNCLVIGAANASALVNWANWLSTTRFTGKVTFLYQLDKDRSGRISYQGIGQSKASQALKILLENRISATLFNWPSLLHHVDSRGHQPNDIADMCKSYGSNAISEHFLAALNEVS